MGIFHSQDLIVKGEGSGHRGECQSTGTAIWLGGMLTSTYNIWFIPIESDGYTIFNTYTLHHDINVDSEEDEYAYKIAVYRQYAKLSDTATALGVGELVAGSTYSSGTLTGNRSIRNTATLDNPVQIPQGSYFIVFHIWTVSARPEGVIILTLGGSEINAGTAVGSWVNESHMIGDVATPGTLPSLMTTNAGTMTTLVGTFAQNQNSFWAGIFDGRDAYP